MRKTLWQKIRCRLGAFYCNWIESMPYRNWFNPLVTIYLNFRSFPLRQAIRLPVFVYGWPKLFALYGIMECVGVCKMGMIKFNQSDSGAPSNPGCSMAINNWGKIIFRGACLIRSGCKINVNFNGTLDFGNKVKVMHQCNIAAYNLVQVGDKTTIAHCCQIFDTNFHYVANFNRSVVPRKNKTVLIGESCWICNTSSIAAGAAIPANTIVASNSLVNKNFLDVPPESIIGGIPAKFISSGYKGVFNKKLELRIWEYFSSNPDSETYALEPDFTHSDFDYE